MRALELGLNTVDAALRQARLSIAAAEARQLLAHTLARPHAWLAAHGEATLAPDQAAQFTRLVARRAEGWPIAYLTGEREFYGRRFALTPEVLIPRPETELLVELGLEQVRGMDSPQLLDLGCGSGCIAITLASEMRQARVTAADISSAALALARRNAAAHAVQLTLVQSDWFAALQGQRFELILANPPYVAAGDAHLDQGDLRFEPRLALCSGDDGLTAIRSIVARAPAYLAPGGSLFLEHGYDQAAAVRDLFAAGGYREIEQRPDLAGIMRVTGGTVA